MLTWILIWRRKFGLCLTILPQTVHSKRLLCNATWTSKSLAEFSNFPHKSHCNIVLLSFSPCFCFKWRWNIACVINDSGHIVQLYSGLLTTCSILWCSLNSIIFSNIFWHTPHFFWRCVRWKWFYNNQRMYFMVIFELNLNLYQNKLP